MPARATTEFPTEADILIVDGRAASRADEAGSAGTLDPSSAVRRLEEALIALAAGLEVLWVGPAPVFGTDLLHHVANVDKALPALETALDAVAAGGMRNDRDRSRRLAAAYGLFGTVAATPEAVADAVIRTRPPPRRAEPTISIIIDTYNYLRFLPDAVASVRAQTSPADQVIVVDDGSTDGTDQWLATEGDLIAIIKKNGGQASAFNAGTAAATSDVVIFLDADDRLLPDALRHIRAAWTERTTHLQFGLELIDAHGRPCGVYPETRWRSGGDGLPRLLADGQVLFMPTSGNAFSRAALKAVMPIPEERWRISADLHLVTMMLALGPVDHCNAVLGQYRVHGRNLWYGPFAREPAHRPALLKARVAAWRDLLRRLPRLRPGPFLGINRLRLHRRIVRTAMSADGAPGIVADDRVLFRRIGVRIRRGASVLALVGEAARLAVAATGAPLIARAAHLGFVLTNIAQAWFGRSSLPAAVDRDPWPFPAAWCDRDTVAGPSLRPVLDHGDRLTADSRPRLGDALGWGWVDHAPAGAAMADDVATLAIRFGRHAPGWTVRLGLDGPSRAAVAGLEVRCNGRPVTWRLEGGDLLVCVPGAVLSPEPDGFLAVLTLTRPAAPKAARARTRPAIMLLSLAAGIAPMGFARPAPLVAADGGLKIEPSDRVDAILLSGWDWPGPGGARAVDRRLDIAVSVDAASGWTILLLGLDCRTASGLLALPEARAGACDLEVYPVDGGRSLALLLPAVAFDAAGATRVTLLLVPEAETGLLPADARLHFVAVDGRGERDGLRPPVPDRRHHPVEILALEDVAALDVPAAGAPARIVRPVVDFMVQLPSGAETGAVVTLYCGLEGPNHWVADGVATVSDAKVADIAATVDGVRTGLRLSDVNTLRLCLPGREGDTASVRLEVGNAAVWIGWISVSPCGAQAEDDLPGLGEAPLDAEALHRLAARPADWHVPSDGALWLAVNRATLRLRVPAGPAGRVLTVTTLTLPGHDQHLSITGPSGTARSRDGGRDTLVLDLPVMAEEAVVPLRISTDRLVNLGIATGEPAASLIGGAVVSVSLSDRPPVRLSEPPMQGGQGHE
ncbi:glycosyltransferase family 2 protein [Chthonobacter rhizosphaerae]|uniref:glycosyltransferase family 2 protein n=1 Tax=Chthonobacter rhizosphaerae TaxID=2735553 RepID=UPI0015EEB04B|nr:glycosyltransferase family 2 protein [Chthonobacter rhizosphaerae]